MLNLIRIFTIILLVLPTYTYAVPKSVEIYIKKPELVGSGRLKFWMWDVYDAYLYGPYGKYNPSKPFALSIRYLMSFSSKSLTDRTIKEIRGQGYNNKKMLNLWKQKLIEIFPDVEEGSTITAVALGNGSIGFFSGNKSLGYIDSPEFTKRFFDIWIGTKTSEPKLRDKLLNQKNK